MWESEDRGTSTGCLKWRNLSATDAASHVAWELTEHFATNSNVRAAEDVDVVDAILLHIIRTAGSNRALR